MSILRNVVPKERLELDEAIVRNWRLIVMAWCITYSERDQQGDVVLVSFQEWQHAVK
jgi:hypothetical protein